MYQLSCISNLQDKIKFDQLNLKLIAKQNYLETLRDQLDPIAISFLEFEIEQIEKQKSIYYDLMDLYFTDLFNSKK